MQHVFKYTERKANTRDPLRRVKDLESLRELLNLYATLIETSVKTGHNDYTAQDLYKIWTSAYDILPRKTPIGVNPNDKTRNTARLPQTPKEFLDGMLEKVNRMQGTDLSPRQCQGTEILSEMLAVVYDIPTIKFVEVGSIPDLPDCFERK